MSNLDLTFSALSDPTRRAIIAQLAEGELALSKLAEPFEMSLTAVSKHVGVLSDAGLVVVDKRGRTRHCRLQAENMRDAFDWLEGYRRFWHQRFDTLAMHLAKDGEEKK